MKQRARVVLCAAITADGRLDHPASLPECSAGDVLLTDRPTTTRASRAQFTTTRPHGDLREQIRALRRDGETHQVLCSGTSHLCRRLLDENLIHELRLLVRPKIDGRARSGTLSGAPGEFFPASIRCRLLRMEVRENECFLHYRVIRARAKPRVAL